MSILLLLLWAVLGIFRVTEHGGLTLTQIKRWPPTVNVEEAAAALGCSRATAYAAIAAGEFPVATVRVNRRLRVLTSSLVAVLEGRGGQAA